MAGLLTGIDLTSLATAAAPIMTVGLPIALALVAGPKVFRVVIRLVKSFV